MGTSPPKKEVTTSPQPKCSRHHNARSPPLVRFDQVEATTPPATMILHTSPFAPVSWYKLIAQSPEPVFVDATESFQKQTLRNRYRIATATGPQTLTIPIEGSKQANIKEIRISEHNNWRRLHWQAICTAYGSSPFFEYYADDIAPFFEKRDPLSPDNSQYDRSLLFDYNQEITETLCSLLDIKAPQILTTPPTCSPTKSMSNQQPITNNQQPTTNNPQPYYQVFQSRQGFLPDMSILDLLFNMGPESILVLTKD